MSLVRSFLETTSFRKGPVKEDWILWTCGKSRDCQERDPSDSRYHVAEDDQTIRGSFSEMGHHVSYL